METPVQLLKLLLNREFFNTNVTLLHRDFFPDKVAVIYDIIIASHAKYKRDITMEEVKQLFLYTNSTSTRAYKDAICDLLVQADEAEGIGFDIGKDLIRNVAIAEIGRKIAELGLDLSDGKIEAWEKIRELSNRDVDNIINVEQAYNEVSDDLDDIISELSMETQWKFNISSLNDVLPGLSKGDVVGILARPEVGKSAFVVSLMAKPGGFADQGAKVAYFGNEEKVIRTRMRCISAYTSMSKEEIRAASDIAKNLYKPIRGRIKMYDASGLTMDQLKAYSRKYKPDIIIVDQMDKMKVSGNNEKEVDRLGQVYVQARELANDLNAGCALIAISQASAEAEGKTQVTFSMCENSKTGKGANTDAWIGIGKRPSENQEMDTDTLRYLTLSKNKLSGWHGKIACQIIPKYSQYVD
jgi:replicative DNA helicase